MISNTAEYALRAIVHLASCPPGSIEARTSQQIAEKTKVPPGYMSKVLQDLGKAGIVHSQRGPGGGFILTRPADQITMLDVINAVDPIPRIRSCPLNLPEHATRLCALHKRLDDGLAYLERLFGDSRISDMMKQFPTVESVTVSASAPKRHKSADRPEPQVRTSRKKTTQTRRKR